MVHGFVCLHVAGSVRKVGTVSAKHPAVLRICDGQQCPPRYIFPGSSVTVRRIRPTTQQSIARQQPIPKVLLKAVNKKKNAGAKTFILS